MKLFVLLSTALLLAAGCVRADGRAGAVEFSDGHKLAGALSLTPGKDLKLFSGTAQIAVRLDEVQAIHFKPEKETMAEGFYFPNAGQATQAKTGEIYPTRELQTEITLADGKVLTGHLFTTTLYVETDDATEKVVLMAKQTGANGQKLTDLVYPTLVRFDGAAASAGSSQIDLSRENFLGLKTPVVLTRPDLASLPATPVAGKTAWTVPLADSARILFAVETADGVQVAWPEAEPDAAATEAVQTALKTMQDFYDTRTLLGSFADADSGDVYSLVMLERLAETNGFPADKKPWSLVILRWKYDPDEKKATLLNRALLARGRVEGGAPLPKVVKKPGLLGDVSAVKAP